MSRYIDATFYVQVEPDYVLGYRPSDTAPIRGARAVGLTQKRPQRQKPGSVLIKLTVRMPDAAFRALHPEAVITIPDSLIQGEPIEVQAEDPHA